MGKIFAQGATPDFTPSVTSGCSPLTVKFTNNTTPKDGTTYQWDLGNGVITTAVEPTTTYVYDPAKPVYTVKLNARRNNVVTQIEKSIITVFPSPSVNFRASNNIACAPAAIVFTDLTTPSNVITSRLWDFGDGSTSTAANPTHVYNNIGYYNVTLTITTNNGCTVTAARNRFMRIISGVTPNFDFSRSTNCSAPVNVNFINQTTGPGVLTNQWFLGNGDYQTVKNPSTTYNSLGTYTVKLITTSNYGCKDSISRPITFAANNTSFSAPDSVCPNSNVSFINQGSTTPTNARWDFGDGTFSNDLNPIKSYPVPGTYTVTLVNQYADCSSSFSKTIKVTPPPALGFTAGNVLACQAPFTVNFQDTTNNSTGHLWDFGDGTTSTDKNPAHTYTAPGQYNVTLTLTNSLGCPSSVTKLNFVRIVPPSDIAITANPVEGCVPFTFRPTASINSIDGVASYAWDFGTAGGTGTGISPNFTYTSTGKFVVKLTITTNTGCVETYTFPDTIRVGTKPTVDFSTPTTLTCAGDTVNFTSTSSPADRWLWDFGDNSSSNEENPGHLYQDTGWMNVTLIAWNNGCADTLTKPNLLRTIAPVALFAPVYNCANPLSVSFTNTSITDASHGPTTYFWDFGNGQTSTLQNPPPQVYPALGSYTVKLTVTDPQCDYTRTLPIELFRIFPDVVADKPQYCRGDKITLSLPGSIDQSKVKSVSWQIGAGTPVIGGASFDTAIFVNGNYNVTVSITDNNDCVTSVTKNALIKVVGSVNDFTVTNNGGCVNTQITLNDQSTPPGTIVNWNFNYGDGQSESFTAPPFVHIYNQVGTYTIKLTTTDNLGCTDTTTKVAVAAVTKPFVNFGAADTLYCPNLPIQFGDTSIGVNLTYQWFFGDGGTATGKTPTHAYPVVDSSYTVKVIATDGNGCIDSLVRTNYIRIVSPKPLFSVLDTSSICPPLETKFFSNALDYDSLYWNFGDGNTSTLPNTSNFYNTYGSYTAKLIVRGYGGCMDSASVNVNVYNPVSSSIFTYGPLEDCNTLDATFNVTPPPHTKFKLIFGDGAIDSSQNSTISHTYTKPGIYSPSLLLTDSLDCQVSVGGTNRITVNGILPDFGMDKRAFCDTGTVAFRDFSLDGSDSIITRTWTMGDGNSMSGLQFSYNYANPGTYIVREDLLTIKGCTNSFTDTVRVYRTPIPVIVGPNEICLNNNLQLNATTVVPDTLTNWRWTYGNGSTSTAPSIINRYTVAGQQTVLLSASNKLGCSNDTSSLVTVWPLPVITNIPEIVMPIGSSVVLPMNYSSNIETWTWQPPTNLSCVDCPTPVANPRFTTNYRVAVVDSNGCEALSSIVVRVICIDKNYFIPNTFSPNNDGQNDVFFPRGNGVDRIQSMRIFNRWGELVFDKKNFPANSKSDGWNGTIRGVPAQSDAYVYIIEVICDNGQIVPIKGNVTLIR